jgi:hypothetical protein
MSDTPSPKRDPRGRFAPGSTGNPNGRPPLKAANRAPDVIGILSGPVVVALGGVPHKVSLEEARTRKSVERAMKGALKDALKCLASAEKYGLLPVPVHRSRCPGGAVLRIPWEWDTDEFIEMYRQHGDPPWPGDRDGLIPMERRTKFNPEGYTVE